MFWRVRLTESGERLDGLKQRKRECANSKEAIDTKNVKVVVEERERESC